MLGFLFSNYSGMYGYGSSGTITGPTTPQIGVGQFDLLQHRVDSLELACAGLWRLLKEKNGFTDAELQAVIHDIDAADGIVDGKIGRVGGDCPRCHNRILSRTANKCLWCGAPLNEGPFK